jgi:hypothetical protein
VYPLTGKQEMPYLQQDSLTDFVKGSFLGFNKDVTARIATIKSTKNKEAVLGMYFGVIKRALELNQRASNTLSLIISSEYSEELTRSGTTTEIQGKVEELGKYVIELEKIENEKDGAGSATKEEEAATFGKTSIVQRVEDRDVCHFETNIPLQPTLVSAKMLSSMKANEYFVPFSLATGRQTRDIKQSIFDADNEMHINRVISNTLKGSNEYGNYVSSSSSLPATAISAHMLRREGINGENVSFTADTEGNPDNYDDDIFVSSEMKYRCARLLGKYAGNENGVTSERIISLLLQKLTRKFFHFLLDNDIVFPFDFIVFRPWQQFQTASLIFGAMGRQMGF